MVLDYTPGNSAWGTNAAWFVALLLDKTLQYENPSKTVMDDIHNDIF